MLIFYAKKKASPGEEKQYDVNFDIEKIPDDPKYKVWNPDVHTPTLPPWKDFEPYLNKLSPIDNFIITSYFKEYKTQKEIGKILGINQSSVLFKIKRACRLLKLLIIKPVKYSDFDDTNLSDRDKAYLVEYSRCLGNVSMAGRNFNIPQPSMRHYIIKARKKLNGHPIGKKLKLYDGYPSVPGRMGRLFDTPVTH